MVNFKLQESEEEMARKFIEEHRNCVHEKLHKPFFSTTGGNFSFIITPTGLGNIVTIKCNACNKEEDITDNSNW